MKVNPKVSSQDIDRLLNSYIDGELPAKQLAEVQRLLAGNRKLAQRLEDIRKCSTLLQTVPFVEAPAEVKHNIKTAVQKRILLSRKPQAVAAPSGIRHLMLRKALTAAAMFALVAVLAAVVYTIMGPQRGGEGPVAESTPVRTPDASDVVARTPDVEARLELTTSAFVEAAASINRAVRDTALDEFVNIDRMRAGATYVFNCPHGKLADLFERLSTDWPKFDSSRLVLKADVPTNQIEVSGIEAGQINQILAQRSEQRRIRAARYFAMSNGTPDAGSDDQNADVPDWENMTIPQPVLTGDGPAGRTADADADLLIQLTIHIAGTQP